jgi:HD-GYP domain-containing protein (c-di-GMP phosphodiesterase class II)
LDQVFGRWDGKIFPPPAGAEISRPARIVHIAHVAVVYHQLGGRKAALDVVRQRAGTEFDPDLAAALLAGADELLAGFDEPSVWDLALESEPAPQRQVPASKLNGVAQAFADFADLKSPRTLGHSTEVAALAAGACKALGLDAAATETVRIAGLVHDLGRVSLPNGIWEKAGRWNASEWERVRLHPYYTERILAHAPRLRPYGQLAGLHHERLDGSGYHRGLSAPSIPLGARVLATADTYQELVAGGLDEPLKPAEAARRLHSEAKAGRLDADVVGAVLEAAGQERPHGRTARPAGLTDREVGVLRLVALGHSNKEVAAQLFISQPTVHTHVLNIYSKIGVRSRAGASLFAMENDLLHRAL